MCSSAKFRIFQGRIFLSAASRYTQRRWGHGCWRRRQWPGKQQQMLIICASHFLNFYCSGALYIHTYTNDTSPSRLGDMEKLRSMYILEKHCILISTYVANVIHIVFHFISSFNIKWKNMQGTGIGLGWREARWGKRKSTEQITHAKRNDIHHSQKKFSSATVIIIIASWTKTTLQSHPLHTERKHMFITF